MTSPDASRPRNPLASPRLWWILGWLVLAGFLVVAAMTLPWGDVIAALRGARWEWALITFVIIVAGWPLWIVEWWLLAPAAHRPSLPRMAQVTALTGTANNSLPIAGVVAAVGFLMVRGGLPATAAMSLYAVDQLLTGIVKVGTLALAAALLPLPDWMRTAMLTLAGVIAVFILVMLVAARSGNLVRTVSRTFGTRAAAIAKLAADFVDHLEPLRHPLLGLAVMTLAVAKKAVEILAVVAIQVAVGIEPSFSAAILVVAALGLATLAPVSPGNLGVYEAAVIFCYQYLGVPLPLAVAAAVLQHAVFFASSFVGIGYLAITLPRDDAAAGTSTTS